MLKTVGEREVCLLEKKLYHISATNIFRESSSLELKNEGTIVLYNGIPLNPPSSAKWKIRFFSESCQGAEGST